MRQKVNSITFNWFFSPRTASEEMGIRTVGVKYNGLECVEITEHQAQYDGDRWYYDVKYSDGSTFRTFNPDSVSLLPPEEEKLDF